MMLNKLIFEKWVNNEMTPDELEAFYATLAGEGNEDIEFVNYIINEWFNVEDDCMSIDKSNELSDVYDNCPQFKKYVDDFIANENKTDLSLIIRHADGELKGSELKEFNERLKNDNEFKCLYELNSDIDIFISSETKIKEVNNFIKKVAREVNKKHIIYGKTRR